MISHPCWQTQKQHPLVDSLTPGPPTAIKGHSPLLVLLARLLAWGHPLCLVQVLDLFGSQFFLQAQNGHGAYKGE